MLAYHGAEAYHSFTHGGGFYRNFFASLKGGADRSGGGLERLFNRRVAGHHGRRHQRLQHRQNISLHPDFNEMVRFTEAEVRHLVETYRDQPGRGYRHGHPSGTTATASAATDLYNTDMVLYYLKHSIPNRRVPTYLIDTNVASTTASCATCW